MTGTPRASRAAHRLSAHPAARVTNLALLVALLVVFATGVGAVTAGESDDRWVVIGHGLAGLTVVALIPWKARVATRGLAKRRRDRWVSLLLAALVLVTLGLGLLHTSGLISGIAVPWIGENEVLWWHVAAALVAVPPILWHLVARRTVPRRTDLRRRNLLRLGGAAAVGAGVWAAVEGALAVTRLPGADRRFTGSFEVASFDAAAMPRVIWLDDSRPAFDPALWRLSVTDARGSYDVTLADLWARPVTRVREALDCTGGWYSWHDWEGVPLRQLIRDPDRGRSVTVTSTTGYWIRFAVEDIDDLLLAYGYDGEPLRGGHGAPARLVAVGSRGYRWVKWVDRIVVDDTPPWWQPVLPLT